MKFFVGALNSLKSCLISFHKTKTRQGRVILLVMQFVDTLQCL